VPSTDLLFLTSKLNAIILPMPAPSSTEVLHLCLRRLENDEPIEQVAVDASLSIRTIQRANASNLRYGSVFPPQNSGGRPKRIDNDVMNVSHHSILVTCPEKYRN